MSSFRKSLAALFVGASVALSAGAAQAGVCAGEVPQAGAEVRGPVLHVIDGETLCIANGFSPDAWIPVRLAPAGAERVSNTHAPPREALMATAFGKDAVCRIETLEEGKAIASCRVEGRSIAEELRRPTALKAAANWR